MGKKENAVVFGLTKDHVFALACCLMDLVALSGGSIDDIIVFHDGISDQDRERLNSIAPCIFRIYEVPHFRNRIKYAPATLRFTEMVYSKYECLALLREYKNVLWLDYDIIVQKDIAHLFSPNESGLKFIPGGLRVREQFLSPVDGYNLEVEGICASTFVFHDNIGDYVEMYDFCYRQTSRLAKDLYLPEQGVFDLMMQEFNLVPAPLSNHIYTPHPSDHSHVDDAVIIHAYSQPKFWNGLEHSHWRENYQRWLDMGGTRYAPPSRFRREYQKLTERLRRLLISPLALGLQRR